MSDAPVGTDLRERLVGVGLLVGGIVATYFAVYVPYAAMQAGAPGVEFRFARVLLGPLVFCIGAVQVALGRGAPALLGRGSPPTWRTFLTVAVMFAIGIAVYAWLRTQATALGYGAG